MHKKQNNIIFSNIDDISLATGNILITVVDIKLLKKEAENYHRGSVAVSIYNVSQVISIPINAGNLERLNSLALGDYAVLYNDFGRYSLCDDFGSVDCTLSISQGDRFTDNLTCSLAWNGSEISIPVALLDYFNTITQEPHTGLLQREDARKYAVRTSSYVCVDRDTIARLLNVVAMGKYQFKNCLADASTASAWVNVLLDKLQLFEDCKEESYNIFNKG